MNAHADEKEEDTEVKVQKHAGALRKAQPGVFREQDAGADDAEQRVEDQKADIDQEQDACDIQHNPAANADPAAPDETGAGAEVFKGLHERLILPALDKAVVGDDVDMQVQAFLFTERFHLLHEAKHMGGDAVHIERQAEHHGIRAGKLRKNALVILRGAQFFRHPLPAGEQFLQEEKIGGSAEALLGTAVDEDGFHRTASSSAGFWRNTTSERSYPSLRAFRSARYRKVSCSASVAGP